MSSSKKIMQSSRSSETVALDYRLLDGEIEDVLIKLEKTYQRNLNIFRNNQNNINNKNTGDATHHF